MFNRSFWTIFIAILSIQILQIGLWFYLDFDSLELSQTYIIFSEVLGMVWTLLLLLVVLYHIKSVHMSPAALFNFDWQVLKRFMPRVIKYFLLCGAIVAFFAVFLPNSELNLDKRSQPAIYLSFFLVVIFAPVVEELIFRGYLYTAMQEKFKRQKERLVVNAMLFAAAHVFLLMFLLGAPVPYYIFFLGYFLAKLYDESTSVLPGIVLHGLNNLLVFIIEIMQFTSDKTIYI
jgi:membrane protease YdiL (CAAX protease family)